MKERIKMAYNATFSTHVTCYDELAGEFQKRAAAVKEIAGLFLTSYSVLGV